MNANSSLQNPPNRSVHRPAACWAALWTALLLGMSAAGITHAAPLTGDYSLDFAGNVSVWDLSGTYYETLADEIEAQYTIVQDADGYFTGAGTFSFCVSGLCVNGDIALSGRVTGSPLDTRVAMKLMLEGEGERSGVTVVVTAKANARAEINRALREMVGRMTVRACATGTDGVRTVRRCAIQGQAFRSLVADPGMDGSLSMSINVTTADTTVTGTALVTLSNGNQWSYGVTGTFNATRNTTALALMPDAGSGSARMRLSVRSATSGTLLPAVLNGKVAGQKISGKVHLND